MVRPSRDQNRSLACNADSSPFASQKVHVCVSDIVTLQKRGIYHGILSSVNGAGSAIGPLMGGVLVSSPIKWRLAFYAQLPIVLIGAVGTVFFLPRIGISDRRLLKAKLKTIDYVGMVLFL